MSYPSAMPMKATSEAATKAVPNYSATPNKATESANYPFKWTALGLAAACTTFWVAVAWLF